MTLSDAQLVLKKLENYGSLDLRGREPDEVGWIALHYSCDRAAAAKKIAAARKRVAVGAWNNEGPRGNEVQRRRHMEGNVPADTRVPSLPPLRPSDPLRDALRNIAHLIRVGDVDGALELAEEIAEQLSAKDEGREP